MKKTRLRDYKEVKKELMKRPEFREEYYYHRHMEKIGERIEKARAIAGITQEELAQKLKTSQPNISRIESGSQIPSLKMLYRIARALKTDLILPSFGNLQTVEVKRGKGRLLEETQIESMPIRNPGVYTFTISVRGEKEDEIN